MDIEIIEKIGYGAFGDVYECRDIALNRNVAIKFFKGAAAAVSNAMDHAKALARNNHRNVVTIYSMDKAVDPSTNEETDCVVMELIKGETLEKRLEGPKFKLEELSELGLQMIDGLKHIHDQGLVHGDFHVANVMVGEQGIKIIDLLYRGTLAGLSTDKREKRLENDLRSLRILLMHLFAHSELDPGEASAFNQGLSAAASIESIQDSFLHFTNPMIAGNIDRLVDHAYRRMTDDHFVEGKEYASALSDETPDRVVLPLIKKVINERAYDPKHNFYVRTLWGRLSKGERQEALASLNERLQDDTPGGTWWPNLRIVDLLNKRIWEKLSPAVRIKLENLIVNDVLSGRHDIHSATNDSGSLGTYASSLWPHFKNKENLVSIIESMLTQSWYTQNYIGKYFLPSLPKIASSPEHRARIIASLRVAVRNDARIVRNNLNELPDDWVEDIRKKEEDDDEGPEYS